MQATKRRWLFMLLIAAVAAPVLSANAGCSSGGSRESANASTSAASQEQTADDTSPEDTLPSILIAPMNDTQTLFENMEALLDPVYAYYEDNDLSFPSRTHLSVPDDFVPESDSSLEITYTTWIIEGSILVIYDSNADVRMVRVEISDGKYWGGMANIYVMAQAVYASSVQGMTPEQGLRIADALHLGEDSFPMPEGVYARVLIYEGYNYYAYKGPSSGPYTRLWVWPTEEDYDWESADEVIVFDIDGNQL